MIAYTTVGTNDIERARAFYDELLALIGARRVMDNARGTFYAVAMDKPMFAVLTPYDGDAACLGNGTMITLAAGTKEKVDALHAKAVALGGEDEGKPGPRANGAYYLGYFRDLDGNKLAAIASNM